MKKLFMLTAVALVLAACGNDKSDTQPDTDKPASTTTVDPAAEQQNTDNSNAETSEAADSSENAGTQAEDMKNDELADYEEYSVLADQIDLSSYQAVIETDNPGTRVILFEDADGSKKFKSVYVKHDNHLKIIDLKDDGLLYNDQLN